MLEETRKSYWLLFFSTGLILVLLPYFFSTIVPSVDLPQHLSQIRLLFTAAADPVNSPYEIHFFGANLMIYWFMLILWWIFPPMLAGKWTMMLLAVSWLVSVFALARKENRSPMSALLASIVVFNASLYWGFANFLLGFPIFILWYCVVVRNERESMTLFDAAVMILLSLALFYAHSLWLLAAAAVLTLVDLLRRKAFRTMAVHILLFIPVGIVALWWYPAMASTRTMLGFDTQAHWNVMPWERLMPYRVVNGILGGLQGPSEWIILIGIGLWVLFSVLQYRKELNTAVQRELFFVGIFFLLAALFLPDRYMNTLGFASRWFPVAVIFLLLSLPVPRFPKHFVAAAVLFLFFTFSLTTTMAWNRFEQHEQSGLQEALAVLPGDTRVLGLDYMKVSQYIEGRPFLQTFSYAQALHGGTINFSFAEHHTGIVVLKPDAPLPTWTPSLDWLSEYVQYEDFQKFDYALINATDEFHTVLRSIAPILPMTHDGRWRLYKIQPDTRTGFVITF